MSGNYDKRYGSYENVSHQKKSSTSSFGQSIPVYQGSSLPLAIQKENRSIRSASDGSKSNWKPLSRLEYAKKHFGSMEGFLKRYGFRYDNANDQMAADKMLDQMRGDRGKANESVTSRATGNRARAKSETPKYENHSLEKISCGPTPPRSGRRMSSSSSRRPFQDEELLFEMEEDMELETPAQRRAIREDTSPLAARNFEPLPTNKNQRRLDPVQARQVARTTQLLQRVEEDEDHNDEDNDYDDYDDYYDAMGHDYEGAIHDYGGEYDGGYNDY